MTREARTHRTRARWRASDDRGVTLPELLVTMIILSIIIAPLGNALVAYMRNSDETTRRISASNDLQILSAYFARDVQSLGVRATTTPFALQQSAAQQSISTGSALGCAGSGTTVVKLAWHDPSTAIGAPVLVVAHYSVQDAPSGPDKLVRRVCRDNVAQSEVIVVHNLNPSQAPTVACAPAASSPCGRTSAGSVVPQQVTLTLSIHNPASSSSAVNVSLVGQRRQS